MHRRTLMKRIRARASDERGFTILEMVIAMLVIFASLTALMYTATTGFRYIGLARERQSATGAATRVMEQIHALTSEAITTGMKTSDLAGDPKIVSCADGYRFLDCTGEKIVHSATAPNATPLVPHTGTLLAPEYPTDYTWATYVTNSDPDHDPYRITVVVSWTGGSANGVARFIQVQSLWSSPEGTAGSALLHPFAGPAQPFFTGSATAPQGTITLSGTVNGTAVSGASLVGPQAETRASAEQVSQVQATVGQAGVKTTSSSVGQATLTIAADGNPSTATQPYDPSSGVPPAALAPLYGSPLSITGAPVAMSLSGGSSGDSGSAIAADAANASTAKCPSVSAPWPISQNDSLPCGWAQAIRGAVISGSITTTKVLGTTTATAGAMTLAQLGGSGAIDTWADRVVPSGTTGSLTMTAKRTIGTLELLGIPAKFLQSNTLNDTNTAATITTLAALQACTGGNSAIRVTAGTATAAASTGVSAANPSASWSGANLKVYTGSGCSSFGDASLNGTASQQPAFPGFTLQRYVRPSGSNHNCITYRVSAPTVASPPLFGGASTTKAPSAGTTLTDATATVSPLVQGDLRVELIYETNQNSSCTSASAVKETLIDVTVTTSLGGLTSRAQYIAPPTGG